MAKHSIYRPTYVRQWRQHRGLSLEKLAAMVPMDKSNLSKLERGLLPYNQQMLERLAGALMVDEASLLVRDPSAPDAIWVAWAQTTLAERIQIEAIAGALIASGKRDPPDMA